MKLLAAPIVNANTPGTVFSIDIQLLKNDRNEKLLIAQTEKPREMDTVFQNK